MSLRLFINNYRMFVRVSKSVLQPKNSLQKRYFSDKSANKIDKPAEQATSSPSARDLLRHVVYPSDFDKKILVWGGSYKTVEDIPKKVMVEDLYRAKNRCRIKAANCLMAATVIGCLVAVYLGRQARARGDTVQKMNLDWHKEYNKKMNEEEANKNQSN